MIVEQAIVHKISIKQIGQRVSFQVRLPRDAYRLVGIEYDVRKIYTDSGASGLRVFIEEPTAEPLFKRNSNKVIGRLSLHNNFCEGLFYQGDVVEDRNVIQYEEIANRVFEPKPWMQSTRREEIGFSVKAGLIQGLFEDKHEVNEFSELEYELSIYFWIEKCET